MLDAQFDPTSPSLVATIDVGEEPSGIAATRAGSFADGDLVYVANREDNTASAIDTATDEVIATIDVGKGPKGVAAGLLPTGSCS